MYVLQFVLIVCLMPHDGFLNKYRHDANDRAGLYELPCLSNLMV